MIYEFLFKLVEWSLVKSVITPYSFENKNKNRRNKLVLAFTVVQRYLKSVVNLSGSKAGKKQTSTSCLGIFNFPTSKFWEVKLWQLGFSVILFLVSICPVFSPEWDAGENTSVLFFFLLSKLWPFTFGCSALQVSWLKLLHFLTRMTKSSLILHLK